MSVTGENCISATVILADSCIINSSTVIILGPILMIAYKGLR